VIADGRHPAYEWVVSSEVAAEPEVGSLINDDSASCRRVIAQTALHEQTRPAQSRESRDETA
jgi:hypothetical protein